MPFVSSFLTSKKRSGSDWWFIFRGDTLLVRDKAGSTVIPCYEDLADINQSFLRTHYLGEFNCIPCYAGEVDEHIQVDGTMSFVGLRPLLGILSEDIFSIAGRAFQVIHWDRTHQFCGRCGSHTEPKADERAKICTRCGLINYPRVSPAIIVAVIKDSEILLARSPRYQYSFYSVLAGFVEPGETFEECVRREVREEVGIELENIRYLTSQPWPFPHTLMVGFTADYAGGEITVDKDEITEAAWFSAENLPVIPRPGSISHQLIEWFIEKYRKY
jgi:NAD+ diphosphatase